VIAHQLGEIGAYERNTKNKLFTRGNHWLRDLITAHVKGQRVTTDKGALKSGR
jgi:hypothetical protein